MGFAWTIVALVAVLAVTWRFLGAYMAAVFEGGSGGSGSRSIRSTGSWASTPTVSRSWSDVRHTRA